MSSKKPVPALIPGLTALTAVAPVLVVAAMAATLFGGVDRAVTYDLLTWTVARGLAWVGMAAALLVLALALRDLGRRWIFAVVALVLAARPWRCFCIRDSGWPSRRRATSAPMWRNPRPTVACRPCIRTPPA